MAKTPAKTTTRAAMVADTPEAKAEAKAREAALAERAKHIDPETGNDTRSLKERRDSALQVPDPKAENPEPPRAQLDKSATKEQFEAADAAAARSVSGL